MENLLGRCQLPSEECPGTGKSRCCNRSDVLVFSTLSSTAWPGLLFWKDKPVCPFPSPCPARTEEKL